MSKHFYTQTLLIRIEKSKNDEKVKVEVEMSQQERRSSIRQGKMLVWVNKKGILNK